jgi:hypothetical protein
MANPYATTDDVQALIRTTSGPGVTLSESSTPTLADAQAFVDQIASEINAVLLGQGYSVPATGDNDVLLLRRYVSEKAAARVWHAGWGGFDDPPARVKAWEKDYADFINRLRQGQHRLVDQDPAGEEIPLFAVVRHPTRDDYFTARGGTSDWDE